MKKGRENKREIASSAIYPKLPPAKRLKIIVQARLGALSGFSDKDYSAAGAVLVYGPEEVWNKSHLILKVKEPLIEGEINELKLMRTMRVKSGSVDEFVIGIPTEIKPYEGRAALLPVGVKELLDYAREFGCFATDIGKTLFTYYHFAASRSMTEDVLGTGITAISLEAITGEAKTAPLFNNPQWIDAEGCPGRIVVPGIVKLTKEKLGKTLVCLDPMSIVAGIEAVLQGIVYLNEDKVRIERGKIEADEKWINSVLDSYPDCPDMNTLKGKSVFVTGGGAVGLSALWQ
ncbi:MAG: hypothetical protein DRO93_15725, partial [Candidatus Thorarchaeota archaeon]